jgi:hypothetical protein
MVNRDVIHNSLIKYNAPDKLIRLIKLTLQQTKMKVKINNNYTKWFETKTGARQGDPLSVLLFSLILDTIGARGGAVVEALCYKLEGCGFDSQWCHWIFSFT